jgi:hypothetical protein
MQLRCPYEHSNKLAKSGLRQGRACGVRDKFHPKNNIREKFISATNACKVHFRSPQSKLPGRIVADASNISNPIAAADQDTQQLIQQAQSRNLDVVVEISKWCNKFHASVFAPNVIKGVN